MSPSTISGRVFLSYSDKDGPWAIAACAMLESEGFSCWMAPRDIGPAEEWGESTVAGIDACRAMVLIFSGDADRSHRVRREVLRALAKGVTILACRVEDARPSGAMEYLLSGAIPLDLFTLTADEQEARTLQSIRALLDPDTNASRT